MTRAEIERANAAHNLEATQFISSEEIKKGQLFEDSHDMEATQYVSSETVRSAARRKNFVLPLIIAGVIIAGMVVIALLLTGTLYRERHPTATRAIPGRPQ